MGHLYDHLIDLANRVLSIRTTPEATKRWPGIANELRSIVAVMRVKKASHRRDPAMDQAADWLRRNLWDASLPDEAKMEGDELVASLKRLVGPPVDAWKPVGPKPKAPALTFHAKNLPT